MTSQATLTYTAFLGGASAATVAAELAAVPPPPAVLSALGVRVISDSTPVASPVVRTIVLGLGPISAATATAAISASESASPVTAVTVTAAGSGYVRPPIVTFAGGRSKAPPNVDVNQLAGSKNAPAFADATLKLVSATVVAPGSAYTANATAIVVGGRRPTGRDATLSLTIAGGHITGVAIVDAGAGYTSVPEIIVVDTAGSGGAVTVSLGVDAVEILRGGAGFTEAPTVVLTPWFQALFPASSDQAAPFKELMTTALEQASFGPVSAGTPVIA